MKREEILQTVIKNIKLNVDGLEEIKIDPDKSIAEYGASSLDSVEIVSSSMRELKIQIPRTEVSSFKKINDLVDLFYKVNQETTEQIKN